MSVTVVFLHRGAARPAVNVLAGSLEPLELAGEVRVAIAHDAAEQLELTRAALVAGERTIVGWSFYSMGLPEAAAELAALRQAVGPSFLAIAGGVHATAEPEETLRAGFDLVAVGEGERTIRALVKQVSQGLAPTGIEGVAWLEDGRVRQNSRPAQVEDLDEFPAFAPRHELFGAVEITRGCIYACRFCATPYLAKARFRHRSVENVARHAAQLRAANLRDLRFVTPTALSYGSPDASVNLDAVEALLAASREALGPNGRIFFGTFPSEVRPEHVTPEALAVLKRWVHNDNLIIGGQSGSARVLDSSRRGHDVEAIERAVRLAVQGGFKPNVDFILGLPGEDASDVDATLALMEKLGSLGAKVHGHTFMPLPGTPFKREAPGRIEAGTADRLDRLASSGRLYGTWRRQEDVAKDLADRRASLVKLRGR